MPLILNQVASVAEDGRRHRLRHREGADLLGSLGAGDIGGFDDGPGGGATRAHDDAGARVRDLVGLQAGVRDRLFHGDLRPAAAAAVEPQGTAIQHVFGSQRRSAVHLAAEAHFGIALGSDDAGFRGAERE